MTAESPSAPKQGTQLVGSNLLDMVNCLLRNSYLVQGSLGVKTPQTIYLRTARRAIYRIE